MWISLKHTVWSISILSVLGQHRGCVCGLGGLPSIGK